MMEKTLIHAELSSALVNQANARVADGWAIDLNVLLASTLRCFMEFHERLLMEAMAEDSPEGDFMAKIDYDPQFFTDLSPSGVMPQPQTQGGE
ncbi:MAG: hypothetical protein H6970_03000 [Gammaproteobacteria bacterium]|nr:hypothetical protein [Gammaproteobacteria bacterium]MCP5424025.1 hypothetical protein [Gammaproteobacteria bacterium]MCP5459541.1 hypothetical protein [Gammaproteobacteria bacterium]